MDSKNFYRDLEPFNQFGDVMEDSNFLQVPQDWFVIVSDIKNSTVAIEAGRYRDVNTVGVAAIVCAQKIIADLDFPYVFGGDGATMVVPAEPKDAILAALAKLSSLAKDQYDLQLRVGSVSVQELSSSGHPILVGKFRVRSRVSIAVFKGGGLSKAENLVKDQPTKYMNQFKSLEEPLLTGLSCRWEPIPPRKNLVVCLLIQLRGDDGANHRKVFAKLDEIFDGNIDQSNPANIAAATYKPLGKMLKDEMKLHRRYFTFSFAFRALEIVAAHFIFNLKVPLPFFDAKKYSFSMADHSDFRKFDDMLRMVLDCSHSQHEQLAEFLESERKKNHVFYGLFASKFALMTCVVEDLKEGGHIHFIDGGSGGYALAAKQLKEQIKEAQKAA